MRMFSFRPALTLRGRKFKGLRGWAGTIGGSISYDYGFNVETADDHPVWHHSEVDVREEKG